MRLANVALHGVILLGAIVIGSGTTLGQKRNALKVPGYTAVQGPKPAVFLHAISDKKTAYVGEQITVSWLLFASSELLKYEPTPPKLSGMWSETTFEPSAYFHYSKVRIGRKTYVVALVSQRALFADRAGPLRIAPLRAKIATSQTALGRVESLQSQFLDIHVKHLPKPFPQGFDANYVGNYKISASVDRTIVPAGEPCILNIRIAGTGAIAKTSAPVLHAANFDFTAPRDFEETSQTRSHRVAGIRKYEYWTTPKRPGTQQIPAIELRYFDPRVGRYLVSKTAPIDITVQGEMPGPNPETPEPSEEHKSSTAQQPPDELFRLWWLFPAVLASAIVLLWRGRRR